MATLVPSALSVADQCDRANFLPAGCAKWGPVEGGTVSYVTFVVPGDEVSGPTCLPFPVAASVVTASHEAADDDTPMDSIATSGGHPRCPPTARDWVGDGLLGPVLDARVAAGPVRGRRWSEPGSGRPDVSTRARRHHLARHPDAAGRVDAAPASRRGTFRLSLIHISEPTRRTPISYAVFCL